MRLPKRLCPARLSRYPERYSQANRIASEAHNISRRRQRESPGRRNWGRMVAKMAPAFGGNPNTIRLMSTLGVNCLLLMQKESSDIRHFLLAGIGKRTVSPQSGTGGEVENRAGVLRKIFEEGARFGTSPPVTKVDMSQLIRQTTMMRRMPFASITLSLLLRDH